MLVVRDLLRGPKRFRELLDLLAKVTPRQLTVCLKELEADGIVVRHATPAKRAVTYELTESGRALAPVIRELTSWGASFALGKPRSGEAVHPEHLIHGAAVMLGSSDVRPETPTRWVFDFPEHESLSLHWDGARWRVSADCSQPALRIRASPRALARLVADPSKGWGKSVKVEGDAAQLQLLMSAVA